MKYPVNQFEVLVNILKQFAVHFDINAINVNSLHYKAYQQLSKNQKHNHLYCIEGGALKRLFKMNEDEKKTAVKFIENDFDFELYPNNCNDSHIETAVKKAIKSIQQK